MSQGRRIGLLGGTFDPPHLGHLVVGDQVRTRLGLNEVWFVVANDPWQKANRNVTSAAVRLAMAELAVGDTPGLSVSAVELETGGPSFTIDTMTTLMGRYPDHAWSLILGDDAAAGLDTWERAEELRTLAETGAVEIVVVNRPSSSGSSPTESALSVPAGWPCQSVEIPPLDVSSSQLRASIRARQSVRFLIPDPVITLIEERDLYGVGAPPPPSGAP